jgi:hypothetical protein
MPVARKPKSPFEMFGGKKLKKKHPKIGAVVEGLSSPSPDDFLISSPMVGMAKASANIFKEALKAGMVSVRKQGGKGHQIIERVVSRKQIKKIANLDEFGVARVLEAPDNTFWVTGGRDVVHEDMAKALGLPSPHGSKRFSFIKSIMHVPEVKEDLALIFRKAKKRKK